MSSEEYEGLFKYKLLIPVIYMISWISMIAGPIYFPISYQHFQIGVLIFFTYKTISLAATMLYINIRSGQIRRKHKHKSVNLQAQQQSLVLNQRIYHAFIIPNYKQDIEVIAESLTVLANHKKAKDQYLIFLAMEAHEDGCQQKAEKLLKRFQSNFYKINYTKHQLAQGQCKAKASNINWCAKKMQKFLQQFSIDQNSIIITIIDCDSWAPQIYVQQIEEYLHNNKSQKDKTLFSAPQIFTRNHLNVPIFNRVMDLIHISVSIPQQLFSFIGLSFTLSNYSISYNFFKKVGYMDTCPDALAQDAHFPQKLYWKTDGEVRMVPIYVPFNQLSLQTGGGIWNQFKARFWQNQRHSEALATLAYSLKKLFNEPFRLKSIALIFSLLQSHMVFPILPWIFVSLTFQFKILYRFIDPPTEIYRLQQLGVLINTLNAFNVILYFVYEYFQRVSNSQIFNAKNKSLWRILQFPIMFLFCANFIQIPGFLISAFKVLNQKRQFTVTYKFIANNQNIQQSQKPLKISKEILL